MMIDNFQLLFDTRYISLVLNDLEQAIAFGILLPSMSKTMNRCQGKLYPWVLPKLLWEIKHPKVFDLGLIGVMPKWQKKGINAIVLNEFMKMLCSGKVDYAETNLNLEDNFDVQSQWNLFDNEIHKRRRCFKKSI